MQKKGRPFGIKTSRNPTYLIATKNEIVAAREKAGITQEQAELVLSTFFRFLYGILNDDRLPSFRIPFLGKFAPTYTSIRRALYKSFNYYHGGYSPRVSLVKKIKTLWPIRQRLVRYDKRKLRKSSRKDVENVYKDWEHIPSDFLKEHLGQELLDAEQQFYKKQKK